MSGVHLGLMEAASAKERMDALCRFVEFWLGQRKPEYGERPEALAKIELPMPLRRLYEWAGRWPSFESLCETKGGVAAFSNNDFLVSLAGLQSADTGKIVFVGENQGVWNCRTLPVYGDDPPVWCFACRREKRDICHSEKRVFNSLSRFLVSFVLREIIFGALCFSHG